jgi:hypothetical protein
VTESNRASDWVHLPNLIERTGRVQQIPTICRHSVTISFVDDSRHAGQVGVFILPMITSAVPSTELRLKRTVVTPHPYQAGRQNGRMCQRLNALL